jgi:hypothetical protein
MVENVGETASMSAVRFHADRAFNARAPEIQFNLDLPRSVADGVALLMVPPPLLTPIVPTLVTCSIKPAATPRTR